MLKKKGTTANNLWYALKVEETELTEKDHEYLRNGKKLKKKKERRVNSK